MCTYRGKISCPSCLAKTCPGCPVPVVLSQLSCPRCRVPAVLKCPGCSVPVFLSQLSCLCCYVLTVLSTLSFPTVVSKLSCLGSPVPALLPQLSCPVCPLLAVLPQAFQYQLICLSFPVLTVSHFPVPAVMFWPSCHIPADLSRFSCCFKLF